VCDCPAELNAPICEGLRKSLGIGICDDEFDPFELLANHVVDGITARPPTSNNGDAGF
jgi:hypothetical protein